MSKRIMEMEKSETEVSYNQSRSIYSYIANVNYFPITSFVAM